MTKLPVWHFMVKSFTELYENETIYFPRFIRLLDNTSLLSAGVPIAWYPPCWTDSNKLLCWLSCIDKTEVKCNKAILFLSQKHTEQSIENIDAFSSLIWRSRTKLVRQSKTEVQRKASSVFWEPLFFWLDLGITRRAAFYDLRAYDDTLDVRNIAMGQQAVSR